MKYLLMSRRNFVGVITAILASTRVSLFGDEDREDVAAYFIVNCPKEIGSEYPDHNSVLEDIDQKFISQKNLEFSVAPAAADANYWTYFYKFKNEKTLKKWSAEVQASNKTVPLQKLKRSVQVLHGKKAVVYSAIA